MLNLFSTMLKIIVLALVLGIQGLGSAVDIPRELEKNLDSNDKVDIILYLESPKSILSQLKTKKYSSREERKKVVANSLKLHASRSQKSLLAFLSKQPKVTVKSFWVSNEVYLMGGDRALISKLAKRSEILNIREHTKGEIVLPLINGVASPRISKKLKWGLQMIDVRPVWDAGINGTGVRVGILDSGVMPTHEALRDSYVGEFGWYAPSGLADDPEDYQWHGTHVMGTILGKDGIGVAPGAQWMACQNIGGEIEALACGEFMLCPHLPDGSNPDCSKAPYLVSNSWGYRGGRDDFFEGVIDAWATAGIVPIFAAGNEGFQCGTLRSPGDSPHPAVITVGSTNITDHVSDFSSFDIAAPGTDVRSSCIECDSCYCLMSGTSMATPHVAGVVALILSAEPLSTIEEILALLYLGA